MKKIALRVERQAFATLVVSITSFFLSSFTPLDSLCSRAAAQSDTDVVATVDGVPVYSDEVERLLVRRIKEGSMKPKDADARRHALDDLVLMRLVEKEVMEQGALDPTDIEKEVELSRLETIEKLYFDRKTKDMVPPGAAETQQFIGSHPEFFEDRRSFYFSNVEITGRALDVAAIKAMAATARKQYAEAKSTEEKGKVLFPIMSYIQAVAGEATHLKAWKASEQVDREILVRLKEMKEGDIVVDDTSTPGKIRILMLYESEPNTLDPAQAQSVVAHGILLERKVLLAKSLLAQLSSNADIRYGAEAQKFVKKNISAKRADRGDRAKQHDFATGFRAKHLWIAWMLALLTITPATIISFHRSTAVEKKTAFFVDTDSMSAILNKLKLLSLTPLFEVVMGACLGLASLLAVAAVAARFPLFPSPVVSMPMGLLGGCVGAIAILLWPKFGPLLPESLATSRWTPVALLVAIQLAGVIAGLSIA